MRPVPLFSPSAQQQMLSSRPPRPVGSHDRAEDVGTAEHAWQQAHAAVARGGAAAAPLLARRLVGQVVLLQVGLDHVRVLAAQPVVLCRPAKGAAPKPARSPVLHQRDFRRSRLLTRPRVAHSFPCSADWCLCESGHCRMFGRRDSVFSIREPRLPSFPPCALGSAGVSSVLKGPGGGRLRNSLSVTVPTNAAQKALRQPPRLSQGSKGAR